MNNYKTSVQRYASSMVLSETHISLWRGQGEVPILNSNIYATALQLFPKTCKVKPQTTKIILRGEQPLLKTGKTREAVSEGKKNNFSKSCARHVSGIILWQKQLIKSMKR